MTSIIPTPLPFASSWPPLKNHHKRKQSTHTCKCVCPVPLAYRILSSKILSASSTNCPCKSIVSPSTRPYRTTQTHRQHRSSPPFPTKKKARLWILPTGAKVGEYIYIYMNPKREYTHHRIILPKDILRRLPIIRIHHGPMPLALLRQLMRRPAVAPFVRLVRLQKHINSSSAPSYPKKEKEKKTSHPPSPNTNSSSRPPAAPDRANDHIPLRWTRTKDGG